MFGKTKLKHGVVLLAAILVATHLFIPAQAASEAPLGPMGGLMDPMDIEELNRAILEQPRDARLFYERGKLHIENRSLPRAILDLDQALRLAPDFPEALTLRGQVYGKLGNWPRAMRDFRQVLERLPGHERALHGMIQAGLNTGDTGLALEHAERLLSVAAHHLEASLEARMVRALIFLERGELARARADFDIVLAQNAAQNAAQGAAQNATQGAAQGAQLSQAYLGRGKVFRKMGLLPEAIKDLSQAISLQPSVEAYVERGTAYGRAGDLRQALADFNAALQLSPDDRFALFHRAGIYLLAQEHQRAQVDLDRLLRLDPNNSQALMSRALLHQHLERHEQAIADYTRLIHLEPRNSGALNNRGMVYLQIGRLELGCADLRAACGLGLCTSLEFARRQGYCP